MLFILFTISPLIAQVSHSVSFLESDIAFKTVTGNDNIEYTKIKMGDLQFTDEIGRPELPVKYVKLIIPSDADVGNIRIDFTPEKDLKETYLVFPCQPAIPTSIYAKKLEFVKPDESIYSSDLPYPANNVELVHHGYFDGSTHIVTLAVYPLQYYPLSKKLQFYSQIDFTLEMQSGSLNRIQVQSRLQKNQVIYDEILNHLVDNPQDISAFQVRPMGMKQGLNIEGGSGPVLFYEYVIITSPALESSFDTFLEWKKRKGLDIGVVTTDDIFSNYTGDLISGIYDDAGELRQYLSDAYYQGTVWVLLGGDYSVVPIRYGCGTNNTWGDPTWREYEIPADNYFADFTGDWNVDNDGFLGEITNDAPDYNPEIFVGRLLCTNATDIANWTTKILIYEQNPGKGDISYLMRSFMMQSDQLQKGDEAGDVADHLPSSFNHTIWEEYPSYYAPMPTFPSGSEVINEMNLTRYGLWSWFAHGAPISICTKTDSVNTKPRNTVTTVDHINNGVVEFGDALDCLTNENYPSIVYTVGCDNTPFDIYNPMGWWPGRNLGEGFTVITKAGGPAMLGNTRYGYISGSSNLYEKFADLLTLGTNDPGSGKSYLHIGVAELVSKQNYTNHYLNYSHNLIGCPETKIWTEAPLQFSNVSITDEGSYITVDAGESGCDISVISLDNGLTYFQTASDVSSYSFNTSVRPLYLTITKSNVLPYIAITGGTISSDEIFTGKLNIIGNLTVAENVTLTIEPSTVIKFEDDVKLEVNGTLNISGTQSSPILFTSINSNPSMSDWFGIIVYGTANINQATIEYSDMGIYFSSGGSGTVENCTISNNRYGIKINRSHPYVANCSIHDNHYPIHLYRTNYAPDQPQLLNNSVYDNSAPAIYLHHSSPDIRGNVIYNHGKGLYCRFSSSPYLGESGYYGANLIYNNDYAVYAFQSSNPFLGQDGGGINGGNNNVIGTDYHVYARYSCNIMAENNYWGSNPPVANKFYAANNSSIDYTPWLPYGPIYSRENFLTDQTNSANPGDEFNPDWPLRKQLLFARDMIDIGELDIAQEICKSVIKDSPDSSLAFFALDILWQAARKGVRLQKMELEQFTNYLDLLANKKDKKDLYAYTNLILFGYDAYNSFNRLDFVINEYKNTRMEELAHFTKFMYFLFDKEDLPSAKKVLSELEKRFPQSESTKEGFRLLSDLDDSNGENFFNKPIADQSLLPKKYELLGNFPNPFNPETKIRFNLPEDSQVKLEVYNLQGQKVITLFDKMLPAGIHTATFNGSNFSSGIYFYRLEAGKFNQVKRMLLIR